MNKPSLNEQQNTFQISPLGSLWHLSPGFVCNFIDIQRIEKSQMKISADVPVRRRGSRRSKKQNKVGDDKFEIWFWEFFNVKMGFKVFTLISSNIGTWMQILDRSAIGSYKLCFAFAFIFVNAVLGFRFRFLVQT